MKKYLTPLSFDVLFSTSVQIDNADNVSAYLAAQDKREGKLNIFSSALPGCVGGKHLTLCLQVCVCMHVCACTRVCVSAYL